MTNKPSAFLRSGVMQLIEHSDSPRYIRLHERDNVVIVVNDQGVPAGTEFPTAW
jgi:hypothetical protein